MHPAEPEINLLIACYLIEQLADHPLPDEDDRAVDRIERRYETVLMGG